MTAELGVPTTTHEDTVQHMRDAARRLEQIENHSHDLWTIAAKIQEALEALPNYDSHLSDVATPLARTYACDDLADMNRRIRSVYSTVAFEARQYSNALRTRADTCERNTVTA